MNMRSTLAIIFSACVLFFSCNKKKDDTAQKVIDDHFKFMNQHNVDAIRGQYADSALIISYVMPGYKHGPLGADEIYQFMFFISPSEQYRIDEVMDMDSIIIVQYDVMGYKALNNFKSGYSYRDCAIFKVKDGKIAGEKTYSNRIATDGEH